MIPLPLLEQRRIEAGVLVPVIQAFEEEIGRERARAVVRRAIARLARETGREIGAETGGAALEKVAQLVPRFAEGGALELDVVAEDETRFEFNVTRCRFAEMYRELGVPELGYLLSCNRDFALAAGISATLELERSQTIMEGATHCDFRFRLRGAGGERSTPAGADDEQSDSR